MAFTLPATNILDKPILQALDAVSSTAYHDIGYTTKSSLGQEFIYRQTSTTIAACTAGSPTFISVASTQPMVNTLAAGDYGERFAGLICKAISNTACGTNYLWTQTKGLAQDAAASTAAGTALYATTGSLLLVPSTFAATGSVNVQVNAIGLEQNTSDNLANVYLL